MPAEECHDKARSHKKREVVEALPREYYLARSRMERFDITQELRRMHTAEARRHHDTLATAPLGLVERKCPYGAPLPKKPRPKKAIQMQASQSQPILQEPTKKYPGLILMDLPFDPTTFPNEHSHRIQALDGKIAEKEHFLEKSDSEAALRMQRSFGVHAPSFNYDHAPEGTISENTSQFFPRSHGIIQEIGCGKDPRFCRPWGPYEQHREAYWRQKMALSSKA
mmetsp:Transcript_2592/g.4425  ORF Transcript_2592/g.4425 Transcript_2592/m.4425 type:complete len:224 (-) Transcript_2592:43-714(-)